MIAILALLVSSAWGLGSFYPQQETVDRVVDGVQQRSYIVIFNENGPYFGMNLEKLRSWLEFTIPNSQPENNVGYIYEITSGFRGYAIWATNATIQTILEHEGTKYVEEDSVVRIAAPFTARPDWGQVRAGQKGARNLATTPANLYNTSYPNAGNATESWDFTAAVYNGYRNPNSGQNTKIWVVDTGVLAGHQEFGRSSGTGSRVSPTADTTASPNGGVDCNGHGTHCAGTAAGLYRGVAPGADIGSVRVLLCTGSGTNTAVIAGFNYVSSNQAAGKSNVMSVSLGGGASQASDDAVNNAVTNGVIAVIAAGNDNNANACNYSPARAASAITVGATARDDSRASFSNSGSCVDVFAPGVSVHSGWYTSNTAYNTISGTSMATPVVAGSVAVYATQQGVVRGTNQVKTAIGNFGSRGYVTGTLLAGTPNIIINSNWN